MSPNGIEVTVIDFGLSERWGEYLRLPGHWSPDRSFPPEFFRSHGGRCRARSDVYAIGRLMGDVLGLIRPTTRGLGRWQEKSQRREAASRPRLDALREALREERRILRRRLR